MKFDFKRMLRLEGAEPTARERWTAFYRLWRVASKDDPRFLNLDALRVLVDDGPMMGLLNSGGDPLAMNLPPMLRWRFWRAVREERLQRKRAGAARLLRAIFTPPEDEREGES